MDKFEALKKLEARRSEVSEEVLVAMESLRKDAEANDDLARTVQMLNGLRDSYGGMSDTGKRAKLAADIVLAVIDGRSNIGISRHYSKWVKVGKAARLSGY